MGLGLVFRRFQPLSVFRPSELGHAARAGWGQGVQCICNACVMHGQYGGELWFTVYRIFHLSVSMRWVLNQHRVKGCTSVVMHALGMAAHTCPTSWACSGEALAVRRREWVGLV
jgi:hypothetical protein